MSEDVWKKVDMCLRSVAGALRTGLRFVTKVLAHTLPGFETSSLPVLCWSHNVSSANLNFRPHKLPYDARILPVPRKLEEHRLTAPSLPHCP